MIEVRSRERWEVIYLITLDPIPIKLNTPASVRDLFAAIYDKVPQDIVLNDLISSFEFAIPKKKKGFELCIQTY